jgi:peroxiredoxin
VSARGRRPARQAEPSARSRQRALVHLNDVDAPRQGELVLAWTAPGCPVAEVYAPRLAALAQRYAARGVRFFGVSSDADRDVAELRALTKKHALPYPLLVDADATLASRLSATTTTTVVVLDPNWRVRYRGAVDDQYDPKGRRAQPEHEWLKDALEAVLSAKAVAVEATEAPGCPITFPSRDAAGRNAPPGRRRAIVRAARRPTRTAALLARVTPTAPRSRSQGRSGGGCRPWHAVGPSGVAFSNDRRLAPEESGRCSRGWRRARPRGRESAAPPPVVAPTPGGSRPRRLRLRVAGEDPAEASSPRFVEVKTDFPDDRWVSAVEVQPGAPDVVHHVLVAVEPDGLKRRGAKMALFTPTSGFFAAMVPGGKAHVYPKGMAKKLPKGATLLFQMHYTPSGVAREDTTRIGFRFLQGEPEREVKTAGAFNPAFEIPPGAGDWEVKALVPVPFHARILSYMPHMHLRGS